MKSAQSFPHESGRGYYAIAVDAGKFITGAIVQRRRIGEADLNTVGCQHDFFCDRRFHYGWRGFVLEFPPDNWDGQKLPTQEQMQIWENRPEQCKDYSFYQKTWGNLMDLRITSPDINYPILRLESESGIWEMGIYPTLYGTRVSCGLVGSQWYIKGGYCCGRSPVLLMETTICIAAILSSFPESATMQEVDSVLPEWNLRPIDLDDGLDKLRKTFVARCGGMQQGEPLKNAKSILDALTEACENLHTHRSKALYHE